MIGGPQRDEQREVLCVCSERMRLRGNSIKWHCEARIDRHTGVGMSAASNTIARDS